MTLMFETLKKRNNVWNFLLGLFCVLLLFSCKSKPKDRQMNPEFAKYITSFTSGNIHNESVIEINLVQDVNDVQAGDEVNKDLFDFSPSIKGKAYWKSTNSIVFQPEPQALKPGTTYDGEFKLGKLFKVPDNLETFYFSFSIPKQYCDLTLRSYSPLSNEDLTWNRVQGTLTLTNSIAPDQLTKLISVNDSRAKVSINATGNIGVYDVVVDSLFRSETDSKEYLVKLNGSSIGADNGDIELKVFIPGMPEFLALDAQIVNDPQECIQITFSDPLSTKQNLKKLITVNGKDNFQYEVDKNILKIFVEDKDGDITIRLFKNIKNVMDKELLSEQQYTLTIEKNDPQFKLLSSFSVVPKAESSIYYFQAVNLWAIDVSIVKIYSNNILSYYQSNNYGGTSRLKFFGKIIDKKTIRLDKDPALRLDKWNTFQLDLSTLFDQDPGAIYQLNFNIRPEYSTYKCEDGEMTLKQRNEYYNKIDNVLSKKDKDYWDEANNPSSYYYDDEYYDYDYYDYSYDWDDRDNPCTPSYYRSRDQSAFVLSSNIGITAKKGVKNSYLVVVNDLITTLPIAGSDVEMYNFQLQKIGTGKTDENGFATVDYSEERPFIVVAKNGADKNYLKIMPNQSLSLSNFDVSGVTLKDGLQAYLYGERGVWRPGDSIFLTMILNDRGNTIPNNHPSNLELFTPQGELFKTYTTQGKDGFYTFKMATKDDSETGTWLANVKLGGVSFSKSLKIETIKPNRLKIRLALPEVINAANSDVKIDISSQWLHGAPAANLKAEVEMSLSAKYTSFKNYDGYVFNDPLSNFESETTEVYSGTLNAEGEASFTKRFPTYDNAPGLLNAKFSSRVYENGGDASIYQQTALYSPYSSYVGLKTPEPESGVWLETDKDYNLDIATVNELGAAVSVKNVNVKIYKVGWSWWWNNSDGNLSSYVNSSNAQLMIDKDLSTTNGKGKVSFKVAYPNWGRFLVLVTNEDSGHRTGKTIYVDWPAYKGRADMNEAGGETMLNFRTNKTKYDVGETANLVLPKSSNGRALVTIEDGSRILKKEWVSTSGDKETPYSFTVTSDMAPNVFICVSLLQPHSQEFNSLPIRLFGVVNIDVSDPNTVLEPVIEMADELKPEKEYTVKIKERNGKPMTYTLAVVDDGLLDLTASKTPNAWNDFYAKQALGVRTWDLYDYVLGRKTGKIGPLLNIGGDEGLNPTNESVKRFKPVVQFVGPFTMKSGDSNTHKLNMPAYFGSVRVMVVAGNQTNSSYGSSQKTVPVKNPLMVISTLPRVTGPGEDIVLPVNVFAMNDQVKNVKVKVSASNGLFTFTDGTEQSLIFSKIGDQTIYFKLKVGNNIGAEKVTIVATANGESATETIDIAVRNPNPPILAQDAALIESKQSVPLSIKMGTIAPKDWVKLELSRLPGLDFNRSIKYLYEYPHGCTEQVSSRVFPALFIGNLKTMTTDEQKALNANVQSGIEILGARQKYNGAFSYWPGGDYISEWATTYATHFMVEADKAGFKTSDRVKSNALSFLKTASQSWNGNPLFSSYYSVSQSDFQQAYRLYVLALANQAELGAMNRLKEKSNLDTQTKWRLAAAYALAGRKDVAKEIIASASTVLPSSNYSNDTFGSDTRDLAMIIETQVLLDDIEGAMKLSRQLAKDINNGYMTTQSTAYSLIAMSKLAEKVGSSAMNIEWELNGVKQSTVTGNKVFVELPIKPQENISVNVTNNGGSVIFANLSGMSQPLVEPNNPQSNGLSIQTTFTDKDGRSIDVAKLKQGTEFYATVVVTNKTGRFASDLVLTEIFASGWEIFNERMYGGDTQSSGFNYQDIRDDRVYTYFNLSSGYGKTIKIKLQAAYCGRFYLPSVSCEAMYNPEIFARTTGQWVEVYK